MSSCTFPFPAYNDVALQSPDGVLVIYLSEGNSKLEPFKCMSFIQCSACIPRWCGQCLEGKSARQDMVSCKGPTPRLSIMKLITSGWLLGTVRSGFSVVVGSIIWSSLHYGSGMLSGSKQPGKR